MNSNINNIKENTPNQGLVEELERLLVRAKKGELRSLLTVSAWSDDSISHGWDVDERNTRIKLVAAITIAQHDFIANHGLLDGSSCISDAISGD